jgi:hypothetical protein
VGAGNHVEVEAAEGVTYLPTMGRWDMVPRVQRGKRMTIMVETDSRSRVVIPGHSNQRFVVQENEDGSVLLQPARVVTEAQLEYDNNPELRELLTRASQSPTVRRIRHRRPA